MKNSKLLFSLLLAFLMFLSIRGHTAVILQYHHISDETPKSTSLSPALFKQHLAYLHQEAFKVLSVDELISLIQTKQSFPDKSVVITFDDGYRSIYKNAYPLLKQYKMPFTVFVSTQPIKQKLSQFMTWDELKLLSQNGATIANHSVTHPHMIRHHIAEKEEQWSERITKEILSAQADIEMHIQTKSRLLAYPYGEYTNQLKAIVSQLGFVAFGQHSGAMSVNSDLQAIPRFPMGGFYGSMEDFILKVNTLPMPIKSIALLDEHGNYLTEHLLSSKVKKPQLKLALKTEFQSLNIQCYLSGQGKINKRIQDKFFIFQASDKLMAGRSKYNCTAPSKQPGRFYWFSQPWIKQLDNGRWYQEN
ncbi:polysaccharide deacetylase family protein [Aliikangiella sp. IMCC44359]|uniref:polysaccharide deacetylase family protein n=1 Tax=Aliikangiella sp. IMCC44359 TaxID=3459125 RepID=UPI00403AF523